jgi:membrane-associated phospholipid phosphatase
MFWKIISFISRCRLENVMAFGVSLALLVFFGGEEFFRSLRFGPHDYIFILLPAGILGVKYLLHLLFSRDADDKENLDPASQLVSFFQPLLKIVHDWFPFLLLSACYYSLYGNLILRINPHTADATLAKIDASILGNQPSILLQPYITPLTTDFFSLVYFSYVLSLPLVALGFYLARNENAFRRVMMGYLTLMLMGLVSYLVVPAIGPESQFADQYTRDLMGRNFSRSVEYIIDVGRVGHDCFPSLHVGIPFLLALYLRSYYKKLFIPCLVYVALMAAATIYLRYHYLIDVLAAFVYAPVAYWLNDFLLAKWPGEKIPVNSKPVNENPAPAKPC